MPRASSGTAAQKAAAQKAAQAAAASQPAGESSAAPAASQPATPQPQPKVFYLMCGFCRWTTRDVGIPDVTSIPGNWKLQENPHAKRVSELLEAYKIVAAREKSDKERKKYATPKRRSFHPTTASLIGANLMSGINTTADKYGIMGSVNRRIKSASTQNPAGQEQFSNQTVDVQLQALLKPAATVKSFDPLPDDFYTKKINVNTITTINQRHANPEFQPVKASELCPLNKFYVTKESKRCNGCEHNVLKPESNITSIKFKLHQMAMFMVPEVRIVKLPDWKLDEPNEVILSITNKSEIDMNVSFIAFNLASAFSTSEKEEAKKEINEFRNLTGFAVNADMSFDLDENDSIQIDRQDNSKTHSNSLRDSDLSTNGFVCFRRDNKIGIKCKVTPLSEYLGDDTKSEQEIHVAFGLKHCLDQKAISDSSISAQQQQQQYQSAARSSVVQRVFVNLGYLKI